MDDANDESTQSELMLLREENARLKTALHRPADLGSVVESMRHVGSQPHAREAMDDAWSVLNECLVIRAGLEQACVEIENAVAAVMKRLSNLALNLGEVSAAATSGSVGVPPTPPSDPRAPSLAETA